MVAEGFSGRRLVENGLVTHAAVIGTDGDNEEVERTDFRMLEAVDLLRQERFHGSAKDDRKRPLPLDALVGVDGASAEVGEF